MTRSSLFTGRSRKKDLTDSKDSPEPNQEFFVVSRFLCQSDDRRVDEADYHGFVSRIDPRRPTTICAVNMSSAERKNCKSDQHCWRDGAQRHALVIDFQDIMTTGILLHCPTTGL